MTARDIVMSAAGSAGDSKTYIEDVFSIDLFSPTSSTPISNGINLAEKGGMVFLKSRQYGSASYIHDTVRGSSKYLTADTTNAQGTASGLMSSFNSDGYTLGSLWNGAGTMVGWTFRKAPKFFDVVTYTGDGGYTNINHSLETSPGMIVVKRTDSTSDWGVYHRGNGTAEVTSISLNSTSAAGYVGGLGTHNATKFNTGFISDASGNKMNVSGATYVAYLFAHDTTTDGLIQCGSFSGSSGLIPVELGWEPQYVVIKKTNEAGSWYVGDVMRGMSQTGYRGLTYNSSGEEFDLGGGGVRPTATGFNFDTSMFGGGTFIYMAIRRGPMKTPTDGTKVFKPIANMGSSGTPFTTGFAYDTSIWQYRPGDPARWEDRLRGLNTSNSPTGANVPTLFSSNTNAESVSTTSTAYNVNNTGGLAGNYTTDPSIFYTFQRAPGFFDVVCYSATGSTLNIPHNLGVTPELVIAKSRTNTVSWGVYYTVNGVNTNWMNLQTSSAQGTNNGSLANGAYMVTSATQLQIASNAAAAYGNMVAYLFASCPGVSKVGSYTGNGSSQTINCGFTGGARFVMIKRTDSTGDWYVWDTARGIVSGNDPHLSLNTTAAEVTSDDSVDPAATGFVVNQDSATNVNVSGASYIYLAIA